jgi:hypothetical protein
MIGVVFIGGLLFGAASVILVVFLALSRRSIQ